jgi:FeS assembly SUF system regulator
MLRLSKLTDYAIVLMAELARDPGHPTHTARELAAETRLPFPVVGKVLKTLAREGLLVSHRGAKGGYGLVRAPAEISIAKIIAALEGPVALTECGIASGLCRHEPRCHVRSPWEKINRTLAQTLDRVTLADLVSPSEIIPLDELGVR